MKINIEDHSPVASKPGQLTFTLHEWGREDIKTLGKLESLKKNLSPWDSPPFLYSPIASRGCQGTIEMLQFQWCVFGQVSAWWCPSPLHAEAAMELTSCPRMLHSQPTGRFET